MSSRTLSNTANMDLKVMNIDQIMCVSAESRLDILVNNAAVVTAQRELTSDGFEMIFGVTHLGKTYINAAQCNIYIN